MNGPNLLYSQVSQGIVFMKKIMMVLSVFLVDAATTVSHLPFVPAAFAHSAAELSGHKIEMAAAGFFQQKTGPCWPEFRPVFFGRCNERPGN